MLLHLYATHAMPEAIKNDPEVPRSKGTANGHARAPSETRLIRDAEEFELEGLMSDDDDSSEPPGVKRTQRVH